MSFRGARATRNLNDGGFLKISPFGRKDKNGSDSKLSFLHRWRLPNTTAKEMSSRNFRSIFLSERESAVAPKQTGRGLAILRSVARQPDDWLGALPGAPFKLIFTSRAIKSTLPHQCWLGAHKTVQRSSEKRHADDEKYRQDVRPVNGRAPFRRSARGDGGTAVSGGRSTLCHSRFGPIPSVLLSGQQE